MLDLVPVFFLFLSFFLFSFFFFSFSFIVLVVVLFCFWVLSDPLKKGRAFAVKRVLRRLISVTSSVTILSQEVEEFKKRRIKEDVK